MVRKPRFSLVDVASVVDSNNKIKGDLQAHHIHCNVYGTYYFWSNNAWVAFVMEAGLDYFDIIIHGISEASDGSTAVTAGDLTLVY